VTIQKTIQNIKKTQIFYKQETTAAIDEKNNERLYTEVLNNYTLEQLNNDLQKIEDANIEQYVNKPVLFYDKDKNLLGFLVQIQDELFFIKTSKETDKKNR